MDFDQKTVVRIAKINNYFFKIGHKQEFSNQYGYLFPTQLREKELNEYKHALNTIGISKSDGDFIRSYQRMLGLFYTTKNEEQNKEDYYILKVRFLGS